MREAMRHAGSQACRQSSEGTRSARSNAGDAGGERSGGALYKSAMLRRKVLQLLATRAGGSGAEVGRDGAGESAGALEARVDESGRVKDLSAQAISTILWASATSSGGWVGSGGKDKNERGEAHVAEGKGDEGKEGDADEAGERDREVSDALFQVMREEVVERGMSGFATHGIANVVWAFAVSGRSASAEKLMEMAEREILQRRLETIGAKSLSSLAWSFGKASAGGEQARTAPSAEEGAGRRRRRWRADAFFKELGVVLQKRLVFEARSGYGDADSRLGTGVAGSEDKSRVRVGMLQSGGVEELEGEGDDVEVEAEVDCEEGVDGEWGGQQLNALVWGIVSYGGGSGAAQSDEVDRGTDQRKKRERDKERELQRDLLLAVS